MKRIHDPKVLTDFIEKHMDVIFKELDKKVALTKEKHFILIHVTDAPGDVVGTAHNFRFIKLTEPVFKKLDAQAQEVILTTKLNNDVGIVIVDPDYKVLVMTYKRDYTN
jgi:hypothetical protein